MSGAVLNAAQQAALHVLMDPVAHDGHVEVRVEDGQLVVDGAFLHADGEWATYPEARS